MSLNYNTIINLKQDNLEIVVLKAINPEISGFDQIFSFRILAEENGSITNLLKENRANNVDDFFKQIIASNLGIFLSNITTFEKVSTISNVKVCINVTPNALSSNEYVQNKGKEFVQRYIRYPGNFYKILNGVDNKFLTIDFENVNDTTNVFKMYFNCIPNGKNINTTELKKYVSREFSKLTVSDPVISDDYNLEYVLPTDTGLPNQTILKGKLYSFTLIGDMKKHYINPGLKMSLN